jgi:hypothetical protein
MAASDTLDHAYSVSCGTIVEKYRYFVDVTMAVISGLSAGESLCVVAWRGTALRSFPLGSVLHTRYGYDSCLLADLFDARASCNGLVNGLDPQGLRAVVVRVVVIARPHLLELFRSTKRGAASARAFC